MKTALITFHKTLERYPTEWINAYRESILNQTYTDFEIFEVEYGNFSHEPNWIFEHSNKYRIAGPTHSEAHMEACRICFDLEYDFVLNTNVDDLYPLTRVQKQVEAFNPDIAVCSGNYLLFEGTIQNQKGTTQFQGLDINIEFARGNNIVAHPACGYSRKFYEYCKTYSDGLISNEIPSDDFNLWKRMLSRGERFNILPETLLYYRYHNQKVS